MIPIKNNAAYRYIPLVAHFPSETEEEFSNRWNEIDALPEITKNKLSDEKTIGTLEQAEKMFDLNIEQITHISIAIRNYYFGNIKIENFPQILVEKLGLSFNRTKEISDFVIQRIINDTSLEKEYQAQFAKLTLSDALKKFPDLGEQLVTSNHIKIKSFPEPVRPSVKNWLFDYTFNMGHEGHDAMARGNYLFQNPNAKTLAAADRQKLEYLLNAYDSNQAVTVNVNTKQLVFPNVERGTWNVERNANMERNTSMERGAHSVERNMNSALRATGSTLRVTRSTEPEDIFQKTEENEAEYFGGTVVKNRQWLGLPKENPKSEAQSVERGTWNVEHSAKNVLQKPEQPKPGTTNQPENNPLNPAGASRSAFHDPRLEFSSPHTLPVEKQRAENTKQPTMSNNQKTADNDPGAMSHRPAPERPAPAKPQAMPAFQSVPAPQPQPQPTPPTQSVPISQPIPTPRPVSASQPMVEPRPAAAPRPIRIVPSGFREDFNAKKDKFENKAVPPKNIVNLKE